MTAVSAERECLHCGGPLPEGARDAFCCIGCRFVARILREENLDERYYALRGPKGEPVAPVDGRDRKWLEPFEQELARGDGLHRIDLDIQGISCAACVWLIDQFFKREPGGAGVTVNPALGTVSLTVEPSFDLRRFVERIESCGYLLGPARKEGPSEKDTGLLLRMGLCIAFAMNGMIVAVALYAGAEETSLGPFFRALIFGFSVASVLVGGSWFFKSAFNALRRGILHLDLPIALGIALAFGSSTWAYLDHDALGYFDPLNVFVALMLVGRFLQQRVLDHNRRRMLSDDGVEALLTRRLGEEGPTLVKCVDIKSGDRLLLAPGDVVPVEGKFESEATLSLDWINGESAPRTFAADSTIPAGAFLGGTRSRVLEAKQDFAQSVLVDLLRTPARNDESPGTTPFWGVLARTWTIAVLIVAAGAFVVGMKLAGDPRAALGRVTAVLIVTCPCAFGIAAPLAYEIVQARLRREGLFVRSATFLDRAARVRRVVFDKTGTLTTGKLRLADPAALDRLDETAKTALFNLASRSAHPKSVAIARALDGTAGFCAGLEVHEHAGQGVELEIDGRTYRLGSAAFAGEGAPHRGDVVFGVDGAPILALETTEDLRMDARREVRALLDEGFEVSILSGDSAARVEKLAKSVGIERAFGDRSPQQKAQFIRDVDRGDTLVIGDGINDGPAVATAFCSGTPAIDRPFLAARSDFYLVGAGLAPIRTALAASRRLQRVLRVGLTVAIAYNVLTVGLAYAGLMTPLLCAVLMPASSLSTILAVIVSLAGNSWRASAHRTPQTT